MTGEGIVISISDGKATIRISKSSSCGHDCASCGACSNPTYEMTVNDPISCKAGDRVIIETDTSKILSISFLLYIFPVFILILCALVSDAYSLGLYSLPLFICLLSFWFIIIKLVNKKAKPKHAIVKILNED